MTNNERIRIRLGSVYTDLAKIMDCFQNIMKTMNEMEEILKGETKSILEEGGRIEDRIN